MVLSCIGSWLVLDLVVSIQASFNFSGKWYDSFTSVMDIIFLDHAWFDFTGSVVEHLMVGNKRYTTLGCKVVQMCVVLNTL